MNSTKIDVTHGKKLERERIVSLIECEIEGYKDCSLHEQYCQECIKILQDLLEKIEVK